MRTLNFLDSQGKIAWVSILAMIMISAALAGCLHDSDDDEDDDSDNGDPQATETDTFTPEPTDPVDPPIGSLRVEAMLEASPGAGWAVNDTFTFDASNSSVTNGEIVSWTFDFGDGNETTVEAGDDPVVEHVYDRGGLYLMNLTVEATDGNETVEDLRPTAVMVSERHFFEDEEVEGELIVLLENPGDWNETFTLRAGASSFNATFQVEDTSTIPDASGSLAFEFPEGEELASKDIEDGEVSIEGDIDGDLVGESVLRITLDQGRIEFKGVLEIIYGIHPDVDLEGTP